MISSLSSPPEMLLLPGVVDDAGQGLQRAWRSTQ
jgi:hypothetical protein